MTDIDAALPAEDKIASSKLQVRCLMCPSTAKNSGSHGNNGEPLGHCAAQGHALCRDCLLTYLQNAVRWRGAATVVGAFERLMCPLCERDKARLASSPIFPHGSPLVDPVFAQILDRQKVPVSYVSALVKRIVSELVELITSTGPTAVPADHRVH